MHVMLFFCLEYVKIMRIKGIHIGEDIMSEKFAVIDTETNWKNEVMSIGIVIAEDKKFSAIDTKYMIISEAARVGGMFSKALYIDGQRVEHGRRPNVIKALIKYLKKNDVGSIFAYNANFDYRHLPELRHFNWHDIMRKAAYREYNPALPGNAVFCSTGRLKSGYSVESMLHIFGEKNYCEVHNALEDAMDELRIMKYLDYSVKMYSKL